MPSIQYFVYCFRDPIGITLEPRRNLGSKLLRQGDLDMSDCSKIADLPIAAEVSRRL